jgi:molecular chaperone DnaK
VELALAEAKLSPEKIDNILLVGGSSKIPIIKKQLEEKLGKEVFSYINPQENVALGAAIQAGIIEGDKKLDTVLVDICPHTLGVRTTGDTPDGRLDHDLFSPIIPKNTVIPAVREDRFFTMFSGQTGVHVEIYQGENPVASKNEFIAEFHLEFKPGEKHPEILIAFHYDINGIIQVSAKEKFSQSNHRLTIDKMTKESHGSDAPGIEDIPAVETDPALLSEEIVQLVEKLKQESEKPENRRFSEDITGLIQKAQRLSEEERVDFKNELVDFLYEITE